MSTIRIQQPSDKEIVSVWLIAAILLLAIVGQSVASMVQKSVTVDEITYIAAGYYHLQTRDFQMNMTNPPFAKILAAIPLQFLDLELPVANSAPSGWNAIEEWQYARTFLYGNTIDADRILFLARLPIIMVTLMMGIYLFVWAQSLYGTRAGIFALFLFSFSPNILAHSHLATQDLCLAAFMFVATYYFWKYVNRMRFGDLVLCGIFFGISVITKSVGLFLLPVFVIYGLVATPQQNEQSFKNGMPISMPSLSAKSRLRRFVSLILSIAVIGIIGLIVINSGYGFQGTFEPLDEELRSKLYEMMSPGHPLMERLFAFGLRLPKFLPTAYVNSLVFQAQLSANSGNVYFAGRLYPDGLWYLMPVSFMLKTPIPTLILLTISLSSMFFGRKVLDAELLCLIFISLVLLLFMGFNNLNVGVRYILPIFPFVFLLISRLSSLNYARPRLAIDTVVLLSIWYLVGTLVAYPHYLSYFNESIGGSRNGYKYLADSNVDWGQDLKALKEYMDEHEINRIKLAYFGSADASYYGIAYDYLPSVGLAPQRGDQSWWYEIDPEETTKLGSLTGMVAVSANLLANPGWMYPLFDDAYAWLREHEPIDQVGHSILIYEIP